MKLASYVCGSALPAHAMMRLCSVIDADTIDEQWPLKLASRTGPASPLLVKHISDKPGEDFPVEIEFKDHMWCV